MLIAVVLVTPAVTTKTINSKVPAPELGQDCCYITPSDELYDGKRMYTDQLTQTKINQQDMCIEQKIIDGKIEQFS